MTQSMTSRLLLSALFALPLSACDEDFGSVTFTEESEEALVMGSTGGLLDMLPTQNLLPPLELTVDLEEELESQDVGPARAVYLDALSLQITPTSEPEGDVDNFDFIESVEVFVEPTTRGSSLETRQVATLADVPEGQAIVDFAVVDDVDLKPYIEEGMRLTTTGRGEVPPDDTTFKAIVTIRADLL